MNHTHLSFCFALLLGLVAAFGCKDEEPCDEDQVSIGTGCYKPKPQPAEAGSPSSTEGGAPNQGAAAAGGALPEGGFPGGIEPPGNPEAVFESDCVSNQDCSELAPICLIPPGPEYCSQIDCEVGEVNEGSCPEDWICFRLNPETRSACLNPNHM